MAQSVYIIEDDRILGEHFKQTLKGNHVELFTNGVDAIHRIDEKLPDVIVLDILLDGPSGFSLLNELQSYSDTATIPVVICSSVADTLSGYDLKSYGVVSVLDKTTMFPSDLVDAVTSANTQDING
jgi:Response regulator containing CheY-like receiver, AAA-type ATPase, and DNA-binding domains